MSNPAVYEASVDDLKFIIDKAKKSLDVGYLDGTIRLLKQAQMVEDAIIIYRLACSPERKVSPIQVGGSK